MSHRNESCHTYESAMSQIWMSHVTHMNESCRTYEWVMSRIWISHITHMNESCHTYIQPRHVFQDMSHATYQWVMSHTHRIIQRDDACHTSMGHVTYQRVMSRINESRHISMCQSHIRLSHATHDLSHATHQWVMSHTHIIMQRDDSCHISTNHVARIYTQNYETTLHNTVSSVGRHNPSRRALFCAIHEDRGGEGWGVTGEGQRVRAKCCWIADTFTCSDVKRYFFALIDM